MSYEEKVSALKDERRYYVRRRAEIKRQASRIKRNTNFNVVFFATVGAILGVIFAVNEVLTLHGPTVTLISTIGAFALYSAAGIIGGGFFAWLAREGVDLELERLLSELGEMQSEIEEIDDEIAAYAAFLEPTKVKSTGPSWCPD